jgi:hypothetical protein
MRSANGCFVNGCRTSYGGDDPMQAAMNPCISRRGSSVIFAGIDRSSLRCRWSRTLNQLVNPKLCSGMEKAKQRLK